MPIRPRTVAVLAATACLASAVVAPAASARTTRGRLALHTTSHRTVVAPARTAPGLAELHNSGRHQVIVVSGPAHQAALLARDAGHSTDTAFSKHFAIRGAIAPHRSIYLRLSRGALYLIDATRARVTTSSIRSVLVTGRARDARVPAARSIVAQHGPRLTASRTITPGSLVHVSNATRHLLFVELVRIGSHTSDAQLAAFAAHPNSKKLFDLDVLDFTDVAFLSPHRSVWTPVQTARGRYVVVAQGLASGKHLPPSAAAVVTVR